MSTFRLKNLDFDLKLPKKNYEMTIFNEFRCENSNAFRFFLPLKKVDFDTKIKVDHFSSFSRICIFWTKNGPLTHCENHRKKIVINYLKKKEFYGTIYAPNRFEN